MRKFVLLFLAALAASTVFAQSRQVSGTVISPDGDPVAGALVSVKDGSSGDVTNGQGQYTVMAPADGVLVFSSVGMKTMEVEIGGRTVIDVTMEISSTEIDEVIVVAYGTARKESYTGSVSVVGSKDLEKFSFANVSKSLDGLATGIITTSGTGQPGEGATIRIRGFGSINSSSAPLYVLDGAPYDGNISSINPNDIASISILKDASASALFGSRAANGVIMITTKRGANDSGAAKVSLKASWGIASRAIPDYDMMNTQEYIEQSFIIFRNQQIYTNAADPRIAGELAVQEMIYGSNRMFGSNQQYNPYNVPLDELIDPTTGKLNPDAKLLWNQNWLDEALARNPLRQEYNVSVTGGNAKTTYFSSLGYLNENGLLKTTNFERISARLNLTSNIKEWLRFNGATDFSFSTSLNNDASGTDSGNVWYSAQGMAPIFPVYEMNPDGTYVLDSNGNRIYDWSTERPLGASPNFNSVGLLMMDKYETKTDALNFRGEAYAHLDDSKYGWAQGLNFSVGITGNLRNSRGTTYYNPEKGNAAAADGRLTKSSVRNFSYTFNQLIGYDRTFGGDHNVYFKGGHEFYHFKYNSLSAQKTGFPFSNIYELNPGSTLASMSSLEHNHVIDSYFGQIKYSFRDKYNFDASIRADGSSRFYKDSRWGTFWSVGVNWRISKEKFMEDIAWIDNLSFRTSYGVQGNEAVSSGYYAWQSFYTLGLPNAEYNSAYLSSLENRTLMWEKNGNFNIGFETRLFDRLNVEFEYFNRKTMDMLLAVPMAPSTGFGDYDANIGSMVNKGVEFMVAVDIFKNKNFTWRATVMGTHYKNEITELSSDKPYLQDGYLVRTGNSLYSFWLPQSAGVDPATGKQLYWVWDERDDYWNRLPNKEPYISDDPNKASVSQIAAGSKTPDIYGSIGSNFTIFRNIDFSFLTTYAIGGKALPSQYLSYQRPLYVGENYHVHAQRAWQQPGDITDIPRMEFNSNTISTTSDLIDASYFAIRNITLGYTFPHSMTSKIGIEGIRIYATVDNLWTFTRLKGFNPQSSLTNDVSYYYIPTRMLSFGININF